MAKEEMLEFDGTVTEVLPDGNFRVKLDNDHMILAYAAGKMRKHRIPKHPTASESPNGPSVG